MKKGKELPNCRYNHCYNVGIKMYYYAKNKLHWDENKCIQMFIVGNLHDIAYEYESSLKLHDELTANALGDFAYANEIRYHSTLQYKYRSQEMDLLYFADDTIDGKGDWCTMEDRLLDLYSRYGNTQCYIDGVNITKYLLKQGFTTSEELDKAKGVALPETKYKRIYNMGLKMVDYAKNQLHWSADKCMQMFVLAHAQGIGYEFETPYKKQSDIVADALKGFKYTEEIRHHEEMTNEYESPELDLLYFAEVTIDSKGNWCTSAERLREIENTKGKDSKEYKRIEALAKHIHKQGFNDKIQLSEIDVINNDQNKKQEVKKR